MGSAAAPEVVGLSLAGPVATITLNRPDTLNAFNAALHAGLREALDRCDAEAAIRVIVLTGAGRAFSAGQDLTEDLPRRPDGAIDLGPFLERDYNPLVRRLAASRKLTIAALNGAAVGASLNIALACDLVVAARGAVLQQGFVQIGLLPDAGGTWLLPRLVGPKRALALMLTGEAVSAEAAERMGLIWKVFDDEGFAAETASLAASLARGAGLAQSAIKRALAESMANDLDAQLDLEADLQRELGLSRDFTEGLAAFKEKRRPRFEGR